MDERYPFPIRYTALGIAAFLCIPGAYLLLWNLFDVPGLPARLGRTPWGEPSDQFWFWVVLFLFVGGPQIFISIAKHARIVLVAVELIEPPPEEKEPPNWWQRFDAFFHLALVVLAPQAWFWLTNRKVADSISQFAIDTGWLFLFSFCCLIAVIPMVLILFYVAGKYTAHRGIELDEQSDEEE